MSQIIVMRTTRGNVLELCGDMVTGDTYKEKGFIKHYLFGKWVPGAKAWKVNIERVQELLKMSGGGLTDITADVPNRTMTSNQFDETMFCQHCQSWCYGSCRD